MKYLIILSFTLILGCNFSPVEANIEVEEESIFKEEYFFDFNKVDHYSISSDFGFEQVLKKESLDEMDKFYLNVINGNKHSKMAFVDSLEMVGFVKESLQDSIIHEIKEVFKSRYVEDTYGYACEPVYRDVFVFKKESKIVGVAKICFECEKEWIVGSSVSTESFGQSGEFQTLLDLLKKR